MMIMQILAAITPHCPQATCSLNIPYMSSDYVGRLANLRESVFDSATRSFCKQIKIFSIFLLYFFDFSLLFATIILYLQHFSLPR